MALGNPAATADWQDVADWQVTTVSLANTQPLVASLTDDDPVIRLSLDVWVRWQNGRQATLTWQSWRYGLVLGPLVINGDGPPGAIVAVKDTA